MGLERITVKEAEELIKVEHNLEDASYFTLTPHIDTQRASEGWETVTYYSKHKRMYQLPTSVPYAQWVYVLSNPYMPNMLKIGYTNQNPKLRVKELNRATGVPADFIIEYAFPCVNGYEVEQKVHRALSGVRVNGKKEFFSISLEEVKSTIEVLGESYKIQ